MLVLTNQASLTPYLEEDGLVLALAGGGGVAGAGLHPIGTPGQHLMPGCGAYTQVAGDRDAGGASSDAESELDSTKKRLEELKKLGGEENA